MNKINRANPTMEYINASFRDPSGRLFTKNGGLYRSVSEVYKEHYDFAKESGLYDSLIKKGLLINHQEHEPQNGDQSGVYRVLQPDLVAFISYPYEWCFSQLKDAALLTLSIQKMAMDSGMTLKDASAFNVQFMNGRPIFIDTLSFEKYKNGSPWVAYKQFCQHFLAPLALMAYTDIRLSQLGRIFIDGVPLDLASRLLPFRTLFKPMLASHIHLHAKSQKKYSDSGKAPSINISKARLLALMGSLESLVSGLSIKKQETEWEDYYDKTNYSSAAFGSKREIVSRFLDRVNPSSVWDLGGNTGVFSRIASDRGIRTVSFDIDPVAIEKSYLEVKEKEETNILPLVSDLTNPVSGIGWANEERESLEARGPAGVVFALALVHHLAISNNVPFEKIAEYFVRLCEHLVIEFVPKSDSQVKRLLSTREDVFTDYDQDTFEKSFSEYFIVVAKEKVDGSERVMYLMSKK